MCLSFYLYLLQIIAVFYFYPFHLSCYMALVSSKTHPSLSCFFFTTQTHKTQIHTLLRRHNAAPLALCVLDVQWPLLFEVKCTLHTKVSRQSKLDMLVCSRFPGYWDRITSLFASLLDHYVGETIILTADRFIYLSFTLCCIVGEYTR